MAEKGGHRCYSEYPFARYEGVAGHQGSRCGEGLCLSAARDTAGRTDLGQGLLIGDGQHQVHRVFGQYDCHTHEGRVCESRGGDG